MSGGSRPFRPSWGQLRTSAKESLFAARHAVTRLSPHTPEKKFLLFGYARSGSTLLVNVLNFNPAIHCDYEILNTPGVIAFPKAYIRHHAARSPAPIYGFKLLSYQLGDIHGIDDQSAFLDTLEKEGFTLIYFYRESLLKQALSNIMARRRGFFHSNTTGAGGTEKTDIASEELRDWYDLSVRYRDIEQRVLDGRTYSRVSYERDLMETDARNAMADRLFAELGAPPCEIHTPLKKQTTSTLSDVIENYDELRAHFAGSPLGDELAGP